MLHHQGYDQLTSEMNKMMAPLSTHKNIETCSENWVQRQRPLFKNNILRDRKRLTSLKV